MADFVSGDTASSLLVTCVDDAGVVINLAGSSIKLRWKGADGTVSEQAMTIVDPAEGTCSYKFLLDELFSPGMAFEVEITDATNFILTNVDLITVNVRAQLS